MQELAPELVDGQLLAVLENGRVVGRRGPRAGVFLARDRVHPVPRSRADAMVRGGRRAHLPYLENISFRYYYLHNYRKHVNSPLSGEAGSLRTLSMIMSVIMASTSTPLSAAATAATGVSEVDPLGGRVS